MKIKLPKSRDEMKEVIEKVLIFIPPIVVLIIIAIDYFGVILPFARPTVEVAVFLLALSLGSFYVYLVGAIGNLSKSSKTNKGINYESEGLNEAVHRVFEEEKQNRGEIKTIEIFAYSGTKYFFYITDELEKLKKSPLKELRVLLISPKMKDAFPCLDKNRSIFLGELAATLDNYKKLAPNTVKSVKIFNYKFVPHFHFMIINQKKAIMGAFQKSPEAVSGLKACSTFIIDGETLEGKMLIYELKTFFNNLLSDKSTEEAV